MSRRRILALYAAFAVTFASLWPLVSAARPRDPQIPLFLCTQSGGGQHPAVPSDGADVHCPLCVASGEAVIPVVAAVHAAPPMHSIDAPARYSSPHRISFAQPPPSRGPPALS